MNLKTVGTTTPALFIYDAFSTTKLLKNERLSDVSDKSILKLEFGNFLFYEDWSIFREPANPTVHKTLLTFLEIYSFLENSPCLEINIKGP